MSGEREECCGCTCDTCAVAHSTSGVHTAECSAEFWATVDGRRPSPTPTQPTEAP